MLVVTEAMVSASRVQTLTWNERQDNVRRAGGVVENFLGRTLEALFLEQWPACIQVTIHRGGSCYSRFPPGFDAPA